MADKTFTEIFNDIKSYQKEMGYDASKMSQEKKLEMLRNYTVALMMEQAEVLEEVSWKPWRTIESQKPSPNKRKIALEWVDCLFFLVDQALVLDLTDAEILDAFEVKHRANLARITNGYSKVNDLND